MRISTIAFLFVLASHATAVPTVSLDKLQSRTGNTKVASAKRASCDNTATSRDCWGDYSIDTNWYDETPSTGVTKEYWLVVQNTTLSPDVNTSPLPL